MRDLRHNSQQQTMWIGKGVKSHLLVVLAIIAAAYVALILFH